MLDSDRTYRKRARHLIEVLRDKGIDNERVLHAMAAIPRHIFVDPALRRLAYYDEALPIGMGQTISQPYTVAFQTASLDPMPGDTVLEIGTGSGYQAAILAEMGAHVYSIERHEQLLQRAREHFRQLGYRVITKVGDGTEGWPAFAPFDGILATAGAARIPVPLIDQLRAPSEDRRGGQLIIPVGEVADQTMIRITRSGPDSVEEERLGRFSFVPFVGAETGRAPDADAIGSKVR
jgi:protein-L-isoaspartate(D-aspartate) O-methyltransferase